MESGYIELELNIKCGLKYRFGIHHRMGKTVQRECGRKKIELR